MMTVLAYNIFSQYVVDVFSIYFFKYSQKHLHGFLPFNVGLIDSWKEWLLRIMLVSRMAPGRQHAKSRRGD